MPHGAQHMTRRTPLCLQAAVLTHVGMRRLRNEDCIAVAGRDFDVPMQAPQLIVQPLDGPCAYIVADGMGGHPAGDVASRLAVDRLLEEIDAQVRDEDALVGAILSANRTLFAEMERVPALYGMGTTVAGLVVHPDAMLAFNVGDSRIYAIRSGEIDQISVDHTMEIGGSRIGNKAPRVLSQCLGGFLSDQALEPHVVALPLEAGAEFLICSDGLHDMLTDADIARCLAPDLAASVQRLFENAMREGGIDNISIIQVRVAAATDAMQSG